MESEKKGKKGIDYSKSKIYRIVCDTTGLTYIGSTVETLSNRLSKHKSHYKHYLKYKNPFITSFKILENNNYKIILIDNCPCNSKEELHREERKYIETIECVNKVIPGRTGKEYCEDNKFKRQQKSKEYYENNKEKELIRQKNYYQKNKDKLKENYEKKKDEIIEKRKEKIECNFCKKIMLKTNIRIHQKTLNCLKFQTK